MQDAIAIAIAVAAGLWLAGLFRRRRVTPPACDGFVPIEQLTSVKKKNPAGHQRRQPQAPDGENR